MRAIGMAAPLSDDKQIANCEESLRPSVAIGVRRTRVSYKNVNTVALNATNDVARSICVGGFCFSFFVRKLKTRKQKNKNKTRKQNTETKHKK